MRRCGQCRRSTSRRPKPCSCRGRRRRAPQSTLSEPNLALITDICARLDGLPLAIELAAARSRALPLQQIASRLNDRFRLLTGGSRTSLPRQQTLHAVVDWSYELLFDAEQRVFERLSVFPGGCDLATAESVCADANITSADVADVLQTLVDKSLVIAQPSRDSVRYTLLQTLAQYGREKLTARGDAQANARCDDRSLRSAGPRRARPRSPARRSVSGS